MRACKIVPPEAQTHVNADTKRVGGVGYVRACVVEAAHMNNAVLLLLRQTLNNLWLVIRTLKYTGLERGTTGRVLRYIKSKILPRNNADRHLFAVSVLKVCGHLYAPVVFCF